jgi:ornithine cyclodeaminase/alanine dehydrogenase-like protein (mu-crystallin family)
MKAPTLQLSADDLWHASAEIDLDELMTAGRLDSIVEPAGRFLPAPGSAASGGLVQLEDLRFGVRCLLPLSSLYLAQTAMLIALGTKGLVVPGEPTVAILASEPMAPWLLAALAHHQLGICHVALCYSDGASGGRVDDRVSELLDQAGIMLSVVESVREAVVGATLVVAAGPGHEQLTSVPLAAGALVINAAGQDLPNNLVENVDQVYVDDLRSLVRNEHRYFVKLHLETGSQARVAVMAEREGWHVPAAWPTRRRVEADLAQVLTGEHRGRTRRTDVVLCELFGTHVLNVALASQFVRIALTRGLGVLLPDGGEDEGSTP